MRHSLETGRHGRHAVNEAPPTAVHTGDTREALMARARAGGWDVVGHRWLRMTRSGVTVEVWFTDVTARVVKARHTAGDGRFHDIDVVHHQERGTSLAAAVSAWLDAPDPNSRRTHRAIRTGSAAHSTEFEAITVSRGRPARSAPDGDPGMVRPRNPTRARTDLSPS